jgi:mono/diheme cytochrome c family protein
MPLRANFGDEAGNMIRNLIRAFGDRARQLLRPKFVGLLIGGGVGAVVIGIGAYALLDYTESSNFCGSACHTPMYPEFTAYQNSVHSTVACTECHVGTGTVNLVRSKLNGVGQLFQMVLKNYPRPITSPVENLRPARETCEQCHTPSKFSGEQVKTVASFASDLANTKESYTLVLKVGGGDSGVADGIHWHISSKVWYVPMDAERLQIGWVREEKPDGTVKEYINPADAAILTPEFIAANKRLMDCVDCHNRTGHDFQSPEQLIDQALQDGSIDTSLPFIKKEALSIFNSTSANLKLLDSNLDNIRQYYQVNYPGMFEVSSAKIDQAVAKLKEIAELTTFPDMNVTPDTHVDNSGHNKPSDAQLQGVNLTFDGWRTNRSDGCFRCHGTLVPSGTTPASGNSFVSAVPPGPAGTDQGPKTLDASCNLCHYASTTASGAPIPKDIPHPTDRLENCTLCHGANSLKPFPADHPWSNNDACTSCHKEAQVFKTVAAPVRPADAKDLPHDIKGLEDCFLCHSAAGPKPMKDTHPWASKDTCLSCHPLSPTPEPAPVADPIPAKVPQIPHVLDSLQDCLLCHAPGAPKPISNNHPWSTNDTCQACHTVSSEAKTVQTALVKPAPDILHSIQGLDNCRLCHPSAVQFPQDHASLPNDFCLLCHQVGTPKDIVSVPNIAPQIQHSINGLGNCLGCHDIGRPMPFPSDHIGRTPAMCTMCHAINPNATSAPSAPPTSGGGGGGGGFTPPTTTPPPTGTLTAAQLYASSCAICHGANLEGGAAPAINATALAGQTTAQLTAKLTAGSMSAYTNSMTSAQISSLVSLMLSTSAPPIAPPSATVSAASNVTSSGATLNGNLSALGSASSVALSFDYGTTTTYGSSAAGVPSSLSAAGAFEANLTSLTPGTTYHFRAKADGGNAGVAYSGDQTFTTAAAPLAVTSNAASAMTTTQATLNGSVTSLGAESSVAVSFDYGPTTSYGSSAAGVPASLSAAGVFSANLTGLSGGTTYHFRARAVGATTAYGTDQTFTTASASAPLVATNSASAITSTGATLNASLSALGSAASVNLSFQYGTTTSYGNTVAATPASRTAAGSFSANLSGLSPGTTYHYTAIATGNGTTSGVDRTFTTTAAPVAPTVVTNSASAITSTGATLNASLTALGSAASVNLSFQYGTTASYGASAAGVPASLSAAGTFSATITGLTSGTTYHYRTVAAGSSTVYGADQTFTTPAVSTFDPAAWYATSSCVSCHGANRNGSPKITASGLSGVTVAQIIAKLSPGGSMNRYVGTLSSSDISTLANWLKVTP